jgi:hypothetical protein
MLADRDSSHRANSVDKTTKTQKVLLIRRSGEQNVELERLFEPDVWMISYAPDNAAGAGVSYRGSF